MAAFWVALPPCGLVITLVGCGATRGRRPRRREGALVSAVDEILSQIPIGQLAGRLGVDEQTAEQATRQALPALLSGMHANAQDPGGAQSLAEAVGQHDTGLIDGGVDVGQVNTADGDKIVQHVFGDNRGQVENQLGAVGGMGGNDLVAKLLPMLAPIVMSYLAKRLTGGSAGAGTADGGDTGLGGLLGGILGGAGGQGSGGIGDLLGGLLGQGRR
jgi:hypothetical protein